MLWNRSWPAVSQKSARGAQLCLPVGLGARRTCVQRRRGGGDKGRSCARACRAGCACACACRAALEGWADRKPHEGGGRCRTRRRQGLADGPVWRLQVVAERSGRTEAWPGAP